MHGHANKALKGSGIITAMVGMDAQQQAMQLQLIMIRMHNARHHDASRGWAHLLDHLHDWTTGHGGKKLAVASP